MRIIDLQRRQSSERADELLDRLQGSLAHDRRVRWNESGHARIDLGRERDDARDRRALAARQNADRVARLDRAACDQAGEAAEI